MAQAFASARIISAAFSAIISVGELVLPDVIRGITEASATRNPGEPAHPQPPVDDRHRIVVAAHLGGADGMEDRRADVARRPCELVLARQLRRRADILSA